MKIAEIAKRVSRQPPPTHTMMMKLAMNAARQSVAPMSRSTPVRRKAEESRLLPAA